MRTSSFVVSGSLSILLTVTLAAQDLPRRKVLIIGIDGTMPSALAVANTPILDALIEEGSFSDRAITHPVTHSAACWSSMFTGVWGDKHGVNDPGNSFAGNHFDQYPNFLKRLELATPLLNTTAFLRWAPMAAALDGVDLVQSFGSDPAVVAATVDHLTRTDPDVFYTILLDVDSAGHSYGWGPSPTVRPWPDRHQVVYAGRQSNQSVVSAGTFDRPAGLAAGTARFPGDRHSTPIRRYQCPPTPGLLPIGHHGKRSGRTVRTGKVPVLNGTTFSDG